MKKILITQSNYIPWKGYFDGINTADVFVVYDEMQYTKRDWRNRNKIKTQNGAQWISIPVEVKGKYFQKINETKVSDRNWRLKHWDSIRHNYSKAPFFKEYAEIFEELYLNNQEEYLSEINISFINEINKILSIETEIIWSKDLDLRGDKSEKLLNICLDLEGTDYYSGPSAKNYMDVELFEKNGINVHWFDYSGYPEYNQMFGEFDHEVSILDLIFNEGPTAKNFMKSFNLSANELWY